jgi:hypothetical protein
MAIVGRIDLENFETRERPLWYHLRGLMQTATGYGVKLTTPRMVRYNGRWRRIAPRGGSFNLEG